MMTEKNKIASIERIGLGIVKVRLRNSVDPNHVVGDLYRLFDELFQENVYQIVFDMSPVDFPNGSFIAMLIGKTMEARQLGGDVKVVNLSDTARSNLSIFTPLTFLSIGVDEVLALKGSLISESDLKHFLKGNSCHLHIDATVEALNKVTQFVTMLCEKLGMEQIEISKLKIAVYEAGMNVVEHGYNYEPGKLIDLEAVKVDDVLKIVIKDQGKTFDFYNIEKYDVKNAFEEKRQGGFGLYIIQRSVDEIKYETDPIGGNKLTLIKKIKSGS